jgi:hypothetical protein
MSIHLNLSDQFELLPLDMSSFSLLHIDKDEDQIATNEKRDFRTYLIDRISDDICKKR